MTRSSRPSSSSIERETDQNGRDSNPRGVKRTITRSGSIGYLPQDPRVGDTTISSRDRILSVRGLDDALRRMRAAEEAMQSGDEAAVETAMRKYANAEAAFLAAGGYAAESEAATIAAS